MRRENDLAAQEKGMSWRTRLFGEGTRPKQPDDVAEVPLPPLNEDAVYLISESLAFQFQVIPLGIFDGELHLVCPVDLTPEDRENIKALTHRDRICFLTCPDEHVEIRKSVHRLIRHYYANQREGNCVLFSPANHAVHSK
jgi:hypothetical protein